MSDIKNKIFKSSLKKKEILLLLDNKKIGYNTSKINELHGLLGKIEQNDVEYIEKYRNLCKQAESHDKYNFYNEKYKPLELSNLLGICLKKSFPFPIKEFSNCDVFGYYMMCGFEINYLVSLSPLLIKFTREQNILLNKDLCNEWVINAGPGTGKTTVANARSYLMKDEGVLLISYTNDAINENYDRLKLYPGMRGILKKRDYIKDENCICVTTVDSFAYYLYKTYNNSKRLNIDINDIKYYNSYDKVISYSNRHMKDICKLKNVKKYKHIIVDESQDIDDQRGNVILNYYKYSNAKSLCLFGDPRQQLHENRGNWYKQKWINYEYYNIGHTAGQFNRLGFCITHRFLNTKCLDITNKLSEKRPDIHVKLFSSFEKNVNNYDVIDVAINKSSLDENISLVAKYILYLKFNCGINYNEMAVIGPSLDKENKTSSLAGKIFSVFTKYHIPCYTKSEGAFLPNAIFFTTIHGSKGREYDYVFLYGCDGFPDIFKMIPNEIGDSLIFVMHSRARKKIIYLLTKNTFVPPRGLRDEQSKIFFTKPELIVNKITNEDINENYDYRISDLSKEHNFQTFLSTNGLYIEFENLGYLDVCLPDLDDINKQIYEYKVLGKSIKKKKLVDDWDSYIPSYKSITNKQQIFHTSYVKKKYISARFWGILNGFAIESYMYQAYPSILQKFVNKKYTIISNTKYEKFKKNGTIFNGIDRKTKNVIISNDMINTLSDDDIFRCKDLLTKNPKDIKTSDMFFLSQCYDYLINGNTLSKNEYIHDNVDLTTKWNNISKLIIQYVGPCVKIEKFCSLTFAKNSTITHSAIGCIDSLHQKPKDTKKNTKKDSKSNEQQNFILEFKTVNRELTFSDGIQVLCYSLCQLDIFQTSPLPILINLQKGTIVSPCLKRRLPPSSFNYENFGNDLFDYSCNIKNTQKETVSYFCWNHIFTYFCRLKKHIEELTSRKNQNQITSKYYSDTFFIDTEFASIYNKNKIQTYPFDIAIINGADPYKSIVSTLNWNNQQIYKQSVEWLSLPKKLFETSIDINTLRFYFHELLSEMGINKAKLCYYICPTDVEWWTRSKDLKIDLGPITRQKAQQKGFISGGKPPRLSEFYDISCYPSDFQPYLQVHTAMSDSLMLYEMVQMDIISIDTH
jgi:hypothetical protein